MQEPTLSSIPVKCKLGTSDLEVARLGFGCFGLSNAYGKADPEEAIATIHRALELGCNLLDTADIYGAGENERLIGRAIRDRRDHAVVASKFGFLTNDAGQVIGRDASPAYVREAVERSLIRLGIDTIDLYTLHRVDPDVAIEDTVGAMAGLVAEGKIRAIGLSEVSASEVRRAHAIHRITAVQSEYSLWNREPEREVFPVCRELGISFVAFAPLGRGLFSGTVDPKQLADGDFRRSLPRFQAQNMAAGQALVRGLEALAAGKGVTPSQLALSWILQKGDNVLAIPGTRRQKHLEENLAALEITWTAFEMQAIEDLSAAHQNVGERYAPGSPFAPR